MRKGLQIVINVNSWSYVLVVEATKIFLARYIISAIENGIVMVVRRVTLVHILVMENTMTQPTTTDQDTEFTHLTEELLESTTLHAGSFITLKRDTVRLPNGGQSTRDYVVHPGAVVVIPLLDNGHVLLERQYRHPVGQVMIELPAGKLDAGEDPFVCGQRELLEETGYTASEWHLAGKIHLAIGYSNEVLYAYFATGLQAGTRQLDEGEFLDVFSMPVEEFLEACRDGRITDAKTLSCAFWLADKWQNS